MGKDKGVVGKIGTFSQKFLFEERGPGGLNEGGQVSHRRRLSAKPAARRKAISILYLGHTRCGHV